MNYPQLQRACAICLHPEPHHAPGCPVTVTIRQNKEPEIKLVPFGFTGAMIPQINLAK